MRASDVAARMATLNAELRFGVTGCRWVSVLNERFPSEGQAHVFEQTVLKHLNRYLADGEGEIVIAPLKTITDVWDSTRMIVLRMPMPVL